MATLAEQLVAIAPKKGGPRDTLQFLAVIIGIALAAIACWVYMDQSFDARIVAHIKPVRDLTIENNVVLDAVIDDLREQCLERDGEKCKMKSGRDLRAAARLSVRQNGTGE